jgi:hypothetical protein
MEDSERRQTWAYSINTSEDIEREIWKNRIRPFVAGALELAPTSMGLM